MRNRPLDEAPIDDDLKTPQKIEMTESDFFENATRQHNTSINIGKRKNITFSKVGKIANVQVRSLAQQQQKADKVLGEYIRPDTPNYYE